jgi:hypothetical protein
MPIGVLPTGVMATGINGFPVTFGLGPFGGLGGLGGQGGLGVPVGLTYGWVRDQYI